MQGSEDASAYRDGSAGGAGPLASVAELRARLPRARLTGLGAGLLTTLVILTVAGLDVLLFGGSPGVYGFFFVLASIACAGWVRQSDLVVGPVAMPIAFAVGAFCISDGSLMGFFSTLSLEAGWLYAGTGFALVIAFVRRVLYVASRRR